MLAIHPIQPQNVLDLSHCLFYNHELVEQSQTF